MRNFLPITAAGVVARSNPCDEFSCSRHGDGSSFVSSFETKKFHCNSRNRVVFGFVEQEVSCTWSLTKFPSMADRRRGVVTISSSQENIRVSSVEYKFVFD